jgi:hypothetical protein
MTANSLQRIQETKVGFQVPFWELCMLVWSDKTDEHAITLSLFFRVSIVFHLQYVAAHITNKGAFRTWDLNKDNVSLDTLDTFNTAPTVLKVNIETTHLGLDKEIVIVGPTNSGQIEAPSNIRVCKAIIHTIDDVLIPLS